MPVAGSGEGATSVSGNSQEKTTCAAIRFALEGDRLDRTLDGLMQLDLDVANVLKVDQRTVQLAAIAIGRKLDRIEAIPTLEAWVARRLTAFEAPEECLKGFVQIGVRWLATRKVGGSQIGIVAR